MVEKLVCSKNLLVGSLLGDLNLQYTGRGFRVRALQSIRHEDWIKYLSVNLGYPSSNILYDKYNRVYFNSFSTQDLNEVGFAFYPYANSIKVGQKKVPQELSFWLTRPEGLAAWFMDDGSKRGENGYILCTDSFAVNEVVFLQSVLANNFNLKHTSINYKEGKLRLRIKTASANEFKNLVEPYVLPSFLYKL